MTRDNMIQLYIDGHLNEKDINQVFDDFENRTCRSCKHNSDYGCINSEWKVSCSSDGAEYHFVEDDFGCNQWEKEE